MPSHWWYSVTWFGVPPKRDLKLNSESSSQGQDPAALESSPSRAPQRWQWGQEQWPRWTESASRGPPSCSRSFMSILNAGETLREGKNTPWLQLQCCTVRPRRLEGHVIFLVPSLRVWANTWRMGRSSQRKNRGSGVITEKTNCIEPGGGTGITRKVGSRQEEVGWPDEIIFYLFKYKSLWFWAGRSRSGKTEELWLRWEMMVAWANRVEGEIKELGITL